MKNRNEKKRMKKRKEKKKRKEETEGTKGTRGTEKKGMKFMHRGQLGLLIYSDHHEKSRVDGMRIPHRRHE
jgi:hypothetical protein